MTTHTQTLKTKEEERGEEASITDNSNNVSSVMHPLLVLPIRLWSLHVVDENSFTTTCI
jgi:hypothetical protein